MTDKCPPPSLVLKRGDTLKCCEDECGCVIVVTEDCKCDPADCGSAKCCCGGDMIKCG